MGDENMQMCVECLNKANAKVGDFVEIIMKTEHVLSAAFIAYMIPLIVFLVTLVLSMKVLSGSIDVLPFHSYIKNIEGVSTVIGLVAMFITYLIIKLNDKKFKASNKYMSVATEVVTEDENGISVVAKDGTPLCNIDIK